MFAVTDLTLQNGAADFDRLGVVQVSADATIRPRTTTVSEYFSV
jgi:hypothetical protein